MMYCGFLFEFLTISNLRIVNNIICMTQFIDISFDKSIGRSTPKEKPINYIDRFLYSTSTALRRKLTNLGGGRFCVSLKSNNFYEKIKYFTILEVFESHIAIKIIPCDSGGKYIRSKQNFNKNGWIRKHINENKNKFLKVNPLTGEVFFFYSCFIPQNLRISKFWDELFEKINLVESEMPELLNKIINLEGKEKPMSFIEQVIQTNKLVCTIKLAERFKQNIKIQSQFQKFDPETLSVGSKNAGYTMKSQVEQYSIFSKPLEQITPLRKIMDKIKTDFFSSRQIIENATFTVGKSNLTNLTLTKQDEYKISSKLRNSKFDDEIRYKIQQFNRELNITIKKQEIDIVKNVRRILKESIGQQVEYKFLDNYFEQTSFENTIMTVAVKELQLTSYFYKNFMTISYETKFRVFIQAVNSIVTLWINHNISFQKLSIDCFTIAKSLTVKLKKLKFAQYIHPSRLQSDEAIRIDSWRRQILKEFSNIYFEIFFDKRPLDLPENKNFPRKQFQYRKEDLIFESLNELTKAYYPNNLFTLIIGLNYFFIQQYFRNLEKNNPNGETMDAEVNSAGKFGRKLQHKRRLDEAKKGGPRVDIILGMCVQFLEEHESQQPDKGGEM